MNRWAADLHIHTALSPCADPGMTPRAIVRAARARGLALIAICDHNSAANTGAVQEAAGGRPGVLAGMELTTAEEVHMVALFPDRARAMALSQWLRGRLPEQKPNRTGGFVQAILDANDRRLGVETRMLAAAAPCTLAESIRLIREQGGLVIAAHVDRPSFSVISQLGRFPRDLDVDAVEVSARTAAVARDVDYSRLGLPVVASSDSHHPDDIGSVATWFEMAGPTFAELALALKGRQGRRCCHV